MEIPYDIMKTMPVATFFYRGGAHSHPVRRTVLLISTNKNSITGYELRDGLKTRDFGEKTPIKSYRKDRIPNWGDYWRLRRYGKEPSKSTLVRHTLNYLIRNGV